MFSLLLVVMLLTALLPAQAAKADTMYCPNGHPCVAKDANNQYNQHLWYCTDTSCFYNHQAAFIQQHYVGTAATCKSKAICGACGAEYGDFGNHVYPANIWWSDGNEHWQVCNVCEQPSPHEAHGYSDWQNNGDGTHTGKCVCGMTQTVAHTYTWTYVDDGTHKGVCACGAQTTEAHYDRWATTCGRQPHCEKCDHDYGSIGEHEMWYEDRGESGHKPSCYHCDTWFFIEPHTFGDWQDNGDGTHSRSCVCGRTETVVHSGGTATCIEKAKCSLCGAEYGTPLGHDLVHHEAQAPTCTQSGHTGGTHCSACGEVLSRQTVIPATGHWFKNWTPAGEGEHQGRCLRCGAFAKADCVFVTLPQADPDAAPLSLCPICGHREDGADLLPVKGAKTDCLYGNLAVFMTGEDEPERLLTVAFEWNGRLLQPRSTVNVTLPAALLDGFDLLLIAPDGTEAQIVPEITDDKAVFTLNFVIEGERLLIRFLRLKQKA